MKHSEEHSLDAFARKGFYAVIIGITAVLVQVVIDMIYVNQF